MMRFWQVLISGIPTLKALREGYGGIQGPGETCIAPIERNCGWGRCSGQPILEFSWEGYCWILWFMWELWRDSIILGLQS